MSGKLVFDEDAPSLRVNMGLLGEFYEYRSIDFSNLTDEEKSQALYAMMERIQTLEERLDKLSDKVHRGEVRY